MSLKDTLLAKQAAATVTTEPEVEPEVAKEVVVKFRSTNNSNRGYQCGNTILRPNFLGIYVPKTDEEAARVAELVEAGILEAIKE